jgi:phage terminase small subunit
MQAIETHLPGPAVAPPHPGKPPPRKRSSPAMRAGLTPKQSLFVAEYLADGNAAKAAIRAGYSPKTARAIGCENLTKPNISSAVGQAQAEQMQQLRLTADDIVREWTNIALVDRNHFVEVRRDCCRYCHGKGLEYQETPAERRARREQYDAAVSEIVRSGRAGQAAYLPAFDERGGVGFNPRKPPNEFCCECFGEGVARVFVKDTRRLPPQARSAYLGARMGPYGPIIKIASRERALLHLARILGMFDHGAGNGDPLRFDPPAIPGDPVEASRAYLRMIHGR